MNRTNKIIVAFLLGTITGFLTIAGSFIAYAASTDYFDREGSTGMAFIFVFAPVGGLVLGAVSALVISRVVKPAVSKS